MDNHTKFRTKDIYIASYLVALGEKYSIERVGDVIFFIFNNENSIDLNYFGKKQDEYWSGIGTVSAKDLFSAFKDLKSRIFSLLNENN